MSQLQGTLCFVPLGPKLCKCPVSLGSWSLVGSGNRGHQSRQGTRRDLLCLCARCPASLPPARARQPGRQALRGCVGSSQVNRGPGASEGLPGDSWQGQVFRWLSCPSLSTRKGQLGTATSLGAVQKYDPGPQEVEPSGLGLSPEQLWCKTEKK